MASTRTRKASTTPANDNAALQAGSLAATPATRNAALAAGTMAAPATNAALVAAGHKGGRSGAVTPLTYANGVRQARQAKGYGRAAIAKALGLTNGQWWAYEANAVPGTAHHAMVLAAVASLPNAKA